MRKSMGWMMAVGMNGCLLGAGLALADDAVRSTKRETVSVRWASTTSTAGYEAMALDRDRTVYVADKAAVTGGEITAAKAIETRGGSDLVLQMTAAAGARFGESWAKHRGEPMAVVSGGRVLATGTVSFDASSNALMLSGVPVSEASRVTQLWPGEKAPVDGPTITAVASRRTVSPGGTVTVDVFVNRVPDLRAYQVTLGITGGVGSLVRQEARVDTSRPDYVFKDMQKLDAADQTIGRLGGVLFGKGVAVSSPMYVGSYVLTASPDASGAFTVQATSDDSTILTDSNNGLLGYTSIPTTITVGPPGSIDSRDK